MALYHDDRRTLPSGGGNKARDRNKGTFETRKTTRPSFTLASQSSHKVHQTRPSVELSSDCHADTYRTRVKDNISMRLSMSIFTIWPVDVIYNTSLSTPVRISSFEYRCISYHLHDHDLTPRPVVTQECVLYYPENILIRVKKSMTVSTFLEIDPSVYILLCIQYPQQLEFLDCRMHTHKQQKQQRGFLLLVSIFNSGIVIMWATELELNWFAC